MDPHSLDRSADEPGPLFGRALRGPRGFVLAWTILALAGFVNLVRAPYPAEGLGWLAFEWALFVATALAVTLAVLLLPGAVLLALGRRRSVAPVFGALLVLATIACLPVERVWFQAEYANGTVPLAQALLMKRIPGRKAVYEPPAVAYG